MLGTIGIKKNILGTGNAYVSGENFLHVLLLYLYRTSYMERMNLYNWLD